jgi:DNA-binding NtrC family response regulator
MNGIPSSPAPHVKRLLVIDDDAKIAALFADFFGDRYAVETADSGAAALAALDRQRPDLVLLDINMPGISGLEVLKEIKRRDERIPVIMVTANNEISAAEQALKAGAFAYLPKPFQLQYAAHLVAAAIDETKKTR